MSVERENSISTSFIVRGVSEGDFSRFCITSFVCNIVILPSLGYWGNYQFICNLTLNHLHLLCTDISCSPKVTSAHMPYLSPLYFHLFGFWRYFSSTCFTSHPSIFTFVLGDTSGIAALCAKRLLLPIFWSVWETIQGWSKAYAPSCYQLQRTVHL